MKIIHKAYKFRLEPNDGQKVLLAKHFGCVRFVYNYFLSERKSQYDLNHKSDNYYVQAKKLTELKKDGEHYWLSEINAAKNILKEGLRNISAGTVDYTAGDEVRPSTEGFCQ